MYVAADPSILTARQKPLNTNVTESISRHNIILNCIIYYYHMVYVVYYAESALDRYRSLTGCHVPLVLREPLRRHGYYQRRHLNDAHGLTYGRQVQTPIIIYDII